MRCLFLRFRLSAPRGHVVEAVRESVAIFEMGIDHVARLCERVGASLPPRGGVGVQLWENN